MPYRVMLTASAILGALVVGFFVYTIISQSVPGWRVAGWHFFTGTDWNFGNSTYGALPLIVGTVLTTALALLLAVPVGVLSALAIVFLIPRPLRLIVGSMVELLAIVPSVIYGVWGVLLLAKWGDVTVEPFFANLSHHKWPFAGLPIGVGLACGMIVLGVMILPTVTAISRDVFASVPTELVEGALSLGATKGQVLRKVVVPSCRSGILGAITLATGRALGETIAMVFVLGNISLLHPFPTGFFSVLGTLSTELANNFGNLTGVAPFGVLCCLALTLMVIVGGVNFGARAIIRRNLRKLI